MAYGVRTDGVWPLHDFTRSTGEGQAAWEGLLLDLYRRGLEGRQLQLVVTNGWTWLAAARQTVYPRVAPQRGWVHKLRNLLNEARRRDLAAMKADTQAQTCARRSRAASPALVT